MAKAMLELYVAGKGVHEIALLLGKHPNHVRTNLHRYSEAYNDYQAKVRLGIIMRPRPKSKGAEYRKPMYVCTVCGASTFKKYRLCYIHRPINYEGS